MSTNGLKIINAIKGEWKEEKPIIMWIYVSNKQFELPKAFLSNNYSCLRNHTLLNKVFKETKCAKNKQLRLQAKLMYFNVIHGTIGLRGIA